MELNHARKLSPPASAAPQFMSFKNTCAQYSPLTVAGMTPVTKGITVCLLQIPSRTISLNLPRAATGLTYQKSLSSLFPHLTLIHYLFQTVRNEKESSFHSEGIKIIIPVLNYFTTGSIAKKIIFPHHISKLEPIKRTV